jgi:hypothetical protein
LSILVSIVLVTIQEVKFNIFYDKEDQIIFEIPYEQNEQKYQDIIPIGFCVKTTNQD